MAFDYDASAETALQLVKQFGKSYTMTRRTVTVTPATGATTTTSTTQLLNAVLLPAKATNLGLVEGKGDERLMQALVRGSAKLVLAAAKGLTFAPKVGDLITVQAGTYEVVACTILSPAEIPLIYKMGAVKV